MIQLNIVVKSADSDGIHNAIKSDGGNIISTAIIKDQHTYILAEMPKELATKLKLQYGNAVWSR